MGFLCKSSWEYYMQFCDAKVENQKEMDDFTAKYKLVTLTQLVKNLN